MEVCGQILYIHMRILSEYSVHPFLLEPLSSKIWMMTGEDGIKLPALHHLSIERW